jgi:hypothetical protein
MLTFIQNLWVILMKAPAIISIVRAIMDVIGSGQVQKILESIRDAITSETTEGESDIPVTEGQRRRFIDKLKYRLGLAWAGFDEDDLNEFLTYRDIRNSMDNHENV